MKAISTQTETVPKLTAIVQRDEEQYQAYCPELELVTAMDTPEEALDDLAELAREYAEDYLEQFELYSTSPNRAHHKLVVQAISGCKSPQDIKALFDVRGG